MASRRSIWSLRRGEVFGFLGSNGAGKKTAQRVLLDVIRPTHGTAPVFGPDCRSGGGIRKRIGYLPGELSLYPNMTGRRFLSVPACHCIKPWALLRSAHRFADYDGICHDLAASDVLILVGAAVVFFILALVSFQRRNVTVGAWPWQRAGRSYSA